jgi:hypothetical protein
MEVESWVVLTQDPDGLVTRMEVFFCTRKSRLAQPRA